MAIDTYELRARYYDDLIPAGGLRKYHTREFQVAGLFATETCHPPHFRVPRHAHELASFYLMLEGGLREIYDRNQREVAARNVVFTLPGEIHSNVFHETGGRCFLVELTTDWKSRLFTSGLQLQSFVSEKSGEITWLATKLYKEFRYPDKVSALAIEGLTLEILSALSRQRANEQESSVPGWLLAARELLNDRFSETLTIADIAEQVGVHPIHLARTFRRRYNSSPGEYQRQLRVEYACQQLATTDLSLATIAQSAGFADQAHFARVFKQFTGTTPAKYRTLI